MAYGLQITNNSNNVIISEQYRNYHVVSSGTYANGATLPATSAGELLFLRPSAVGGKLSTSAALISTGGVIIVNSTTGFVSWVIVRERPSATLDGYGLRVYTDTGAISFDSNRRYLNPITTVRWLQPAYGGTQGISMPYPLMASRQRFILASAFRITGIAESGAGMWDYWRGTSITWTSDTGMTLEENIIAGQAPGGTWFPVWGGTLMFSFADI